MRNEIGGCTGLGAIGKLHANNLEFKCLSFTEFKKKKMGTTREEFEKRFQWFRRIGFGGCPMYLWYHPLQPYQRKYCWNDASLCHTLVLDAIKFSLLSPDWLLVRDRDSRDFGKKRVNASDGLTIIAARVFEEAFRNNKRFDVSQIVHRVDCAVIQAAHQIPEQVAK